jgi:hypothetical protein
MVANSVPDPELEPSLMALSLWKENPVVRLSDPVVLGSNRRRTCIYKDLASFCNSHKTALEAGAKGTTMHVP